MSDQMIHPLIFECYKCKKDSNYPNTLKEGDDNTSANTLVKLCTNCSARNTVEIPAGYYVLNNATILRGLKKEDSK